MEAPVPRGSRPRPAVADAWRRVCRGRIGDSGVVRDGPPAAEAGFPPALIFTSGNRSPSIAVPPAGSGGAAAPSGSLLRLGCRVSQCAPLQPGSPRSAQRLASAPVALLCPGRVPGPSPSLLCAFLVFVYVEIAASALVYLSLLGLRPGWHTGFIPCCTLVAKGHLKCSHIGPGVRDREG